VNSRKTTLVLATTNEGKAREIRFALRDLPLNIVTLPDIGVDVPFPETGATFRENALGKSLFYGSRSEHLTLAEDSGLVVDALNGAPGVHSARFSDPGATDARNIRKLLRQLKAVPDKKRGAKFVCAMVLSERGHVVKSTRGEVRGTIGRAGKGGLGFGYDPVFEYRPLGKTFGELEADEKNAVSHRGRALAKMKAFLAECLKRDRPAPL
jgi:XTP/dITP diphosphohydrolase